ncbi:hypothetical protein CFE70_003128 [Pyrenophora teres f. teres 0-1]
MSSSFTGLHLVWIHDRIFTKPIPRYHLSRDFWEVYLDQKPESPDNGKSNLCAAATGFLRTYRYLIRHESDFYLAQQDSFRLIPKDLRLTRLNFYAPLLLRKFHFEQVHGQYGDYFARLYGPVLFLFAVVSTILNSMQVALAADQSLAVHWIPVWHAPRWFSFISICEPSLVEQRGENCDRKHTIDFSHRSVLAESEFVAQDAEMWAPFEKLAVDPPLTMGRRKIAVFLL